MTKHLYFCGIGGSGLFPLAQIALDLGFRVSGSDQETSQHTDWLKQHGTKIFTSQNGKDIAKLHTKSPIDWFIGSSALAADHPELVFAKHQINRVSKRDEFVNQVIADKKLKLIAVSGTHGKTTVTGMLIWLLQQVHQPVSYAIGTDINFGNSGQYQDSSQYFIYEADEFDRNFLAFKPYIGVIPTIEYDHSDTYPSTENYKQAFKKFINQSHCAFLNKSAADYLDIQQRACLHEFSVSPGELSQVRLPGEHNRRNGLLAVEAAKSVVKSDELSLLAALNKFPGTGRRMEKLADKLYSDYAHLPSEISATLQLAKELSSQVVAVYQPHQNIRQHEIKDQYRDCFKLAKKVYWLPTYLSREYKKLPVLTPQQLLAKLDQSTNVESADMDEKLVTKLKKHLGSGDTVVVMGAGSIDSWTRQHLL